MIQSLQIENIALIESLTIAFGEGLHVMSGETGAGKSIVVDAVNLVLGGRADKDLIRTGTEKATVEAVFDIAGNQTVLQQLTTNEIETDGDTVTLWRSISRTGRNVCRINGTPVTLAVLRETADLLMDVHGQHEQAFLMNPLKHLAFLDAFDKDDHLQVLAEVEASYISFMQNHRAYAKLVKENEKKHARFGELEKSIAELKKAKLKSG